MRRVIKRLISQGEEARCVPSHSDFGLASFSPTQLMVAGYGLTGSIAVDLIVIADGAFEPYPSRGAWINGFKMG
jgi:hypothetical protein